MAGKKAYLTALAARKRILVAESDLNREVMARELENLADAARGMIAKAKNLGSTATWVALLTSLFFKVFPRPTPEAGAKRSWLATLAGGIGKGMEIWSAIKDRARHSQSGTKPSTPGAS